MGASEGLGRQSPISERCVLIKGSQEMGEGEPEA